NLTALRSLKNSQSLRGLAGWSSALSFQSQIQGGGPPREGAKRAADASAATRLIERLFREHNETLLLFLRARLNCEADANEVAQEAYVRLLQLDRPDQPSFLR